MLSRDEYIENNDRYEHVFHSVDFAALPGLLGKFLGLRCKEKS